MNPSVKERHKRGGEIIENFELSICRLRNPHQCLRPYHVENTSSRPITEVKQRRSWLVLGWVTALEYQFLLFARPAQRTGHEMAHFSSENYNWTEICCWIARESCSEMAHFSYSFLHQKTTTVQNYGKFQFSDHFSLMWTAVFCQVAVFWYRKL